MEQAHFRRHSRADERRDDHRQRQQSGMGRRGRRLVHNHDRRRQIADGRRGRPVRIVKYVIGAAEIDGLIGRGRRHVEFDDVEFLRRRERRAQIGQPQARVLGVGAARIGAQVAPIGVRRIGEIGPPPGKCLAAQRQHGAHARRIARVRIGREEIAIALDRVAFERGREGVLDRIFADGPRLQSCIGLGGDRRRRVRRAGDQRGSGGELRFVPGNDRALGDLGNAHAGLGESLVDRQAGLAQGLRQRLGVDSIGAGLVRRD
jgi:hypothetical protein